MNISATDEIAAIRLMCEQQWQMGEEVRWTSRNNLHGKVTALIMQGMEGPDNRDMRLKILEQFTGRKINTSRKLTQWECESIITALKDTNDEKWSITERAARTIHNAELLARMSAEQWGGGEDDAGGNGAFRFPEDLLCTEGAKTGSLPDKGNKSPWPDVSDLW